MSSNLQLFAEVNTSEEGVQWKRISLLVGVISFEVAIGWGRITTIELIAGIIGTLIGKPATL